MWHFSCFPQSFLVEAEDNKVLENTKKNHTHKLPKVNVPEEIPLGKNGHDVGNKAEWREGQLVQSAYSSLSQHERIQHTALCPGFIITYQKGAATNLFYFFYSIWMSSVHLRLLLR